MATTNQFRVPHVRHLMEDLGCDFDFSILGDARGITYYPNDSISEHYERGIVTRNTYVNSAVEFTIGSKPKWLCKICWALNSYNVVIRVLPMSRKDHRSYFDHGFCDADGIKEYIERCTGIALSF